MATNLRQPSVRVSYGYSTDRVATLGMVGLRCRINLHLVTDMGAVADPLSFVVDSGSSYSLIDLELAASRFLPVPPAELDLELRTTRGLVTLRVRPGRIRGWWNAERRGYPFDWPVLFRVGGSLGSPSILGLGGVVKTCSWHFDGRYSPDAPYGAFTLDDGR